MTEQIQPLNSEDIAYLAAAPLLVVAMDFDGTLAPFSDDPAACRAETGAMDALKDLAAMPGTHVMVISGRNLQQLAGATELDPAIAALAPAPGSGSLDGAPTPDSSAGAVAPASPHSAHAAPAGIVRMIGSHGAEAADGPALALTDAQKELLSQLARFAERQAARCAGMWVERKPLSVGLHTRTAVDPAIAADAIAEYQDFAQENPACKVTLGKNILEVAVSTATKGRYVQSFLEAFEQNAGRPVDAVVFAGDDTTDETVMEMLTPGRDLGIKVGDGASAGNRHLAATTDVRDFLLALRDARSQRLSIGS